MRKMYWLAIAIAMTLTSCGHSVEELGRKTAKLNCEAQKNAQKALDGDLSVANESSKLAAELAELEKEYKEHYTSEEDKQKFEQAFMSEMANCK